MAQVLQYLLRFGFLVCLPLRLPAEPRFFIDDPLWALPPPAPILGPNPVSLNALYDFVRQSANPDPRPPVRSGAINTLGEVPDSLWFTNRHARRRMSLEELRRGPGNTSRPVPPYIVVQAKFEGISPGFEIEDARGRRFLAKADPLSNPEMASAADVIASKFFYALGYNTPENYIVTIERAQLKPGPRATVAGAGKRRRPMTEKDLDEILERVPRLPNNAFRMMASLFVPGQPIGPFRYEGTRSDDPNDIVPHEQRRDLRGLHVLCAWLNHTDSRSANTLDTVVEERGVRVIRHYLIDFGAALGSDTDMPKDARFGYEYIIPKPRVVLKKMWTFGLLVEPWERAVHPNDIHVGRFEAQVFDPEKWVPNYPNPAFLSRGAEDEYWAAKLVMSFTDEEIRAIVATGQYSSGSSLNYVARTLSARRDKIGRTYFRKVLALDGFRVAAGTLAFDDLAVQHGFLPPRRYTVEWSRFDNATGVHYLLPGATSFEVPAVDAPYLAARIHAVGDPRRSVTVYLRRGREVVGIERSF
jgi:hypothetical protein